MSLRVTQSMMHLQLYRNINRNMSQLEDIQNQTATGRKINKPSDDPVGMTYSLRYRAELSDASQYKKNVESGLSWLDYNDTLLDQTGTILKRVKDLTVQASNGTNSDVSLDSIKIEIEQLKEQLVEIGNSTFNGKYVFNGEMTDQPLFNTSDPNFDPKSVSGDSGQIRYSISNEMRIDLNISASEVFGAADPAGSTDNLFSVLDRIIDGLSSGNTSAVGAELGAVEANIDRVINTRSVIGARVNRLELMQNRLEDSELNLTNMKSKTEDAEYERLLIDAQVNENIYQASLAVGAKIIQQSLVDFLR